VAVSAAASDRKGMPSTITSKLAAAVAPVAAAATLVFAPTASADITCTKVVSPGDSVSDLVKSLSPGETGCLHGGTYLEDVRIGQGGSAGSRLTLTSYPGERAKVIGRFYVPKGSNYVTVSNLDLNGTPKRGTNDANDPSPTINAENVTFQGNEVTNDHHAICFLLGTSWGAVKNTVIDGNRIHDCGRLPSTNYDHGIYVELSTNAKIVNNVIYDNSDRGVQLYHDSQGTLVSNNVIDGNGEGILFAGDYGYASSNNTIEDNIITNSVERNNVESWWPSGNPIGHNNVVRENCIGGGVRDHGDGGISTQWGFKLGVNNVISKSPKFRDRAGKDFRLSDGSPCTGIANGATGSTAARPGVKTPTDSTPSTPNPPTSTPTSTPTNSSPAGVSLRSRSRRGRIRLLGRVNRGGLHSAASANRLTIQLKWAGVWYPLKSVRLHGSRFDLQLRLPATMRGKVLKLRALVPSVGRSRAVRVRVR
jgi:parallel beta-helix repeat protein